MSELGAGSLCSLVHRLQLIVLDVCEHTSTSFVILEFDERSRGVTRLSVHRDEVEGEAVASRGA